MERRLPKDGDGERGVGRLRLVAAASASIAALYVVVLTDFAWPSMALALGVTLAVRFWARSWARTEREAVQGGAPPLVLGDDALELGARRVRWADIVRVELDDDLLRVRVVPRDGAVLELEPPYGGLGLRALGEAVEAARRAGRAR